MDTIPIVETETRLVGELARLKSRLAQGMRDHQRSHDELQRLEGEIRTTEYELRTYRRDHLPSVYSEEELAGACDSVVFALRVGPNPQSHQQLSGRSRLDPRLVILAVMRLTREGRARIEQPQSEDARVWLVSTSGA
jgi:hypothetical protein